MSKENTQRQTPVTPYPKLLLQVHDELVFEVPSGEVKKFAAEVKKTMENVFKLIVPLKVDIKVGKNWKEMEAVNSEQLTKN